jgi:uncharacterized protein (TIGR02996 family)
MTQDDRPFLSAIQASPADATLRLVYADWLEERGDTRAEFLRLHLLLKSFDPDDLNRVEAERQLSCLRKSADATWLAIIEPEHFLREDDRGWCKCVEDWHRKTPFPESKFHREVQDTECDVWKRLLDLVEQSAEDGRTDFEPRQAAKDAHEWSQIRTLPATIAKLKSVKTLWLYGSHLVRVPPEIGEMSSLEDFDPYTSYALHWFPYEITRCKNLRRSRVSTRALYGNRNYRPPFPRLMPPNASEPAMRWGLHSTRNCSVCDRPFEDRRLHRFWISLRVATDVLPLLVNACSEECIHQLPQPPENYVQEPHRGGLKVQQPPPR